MIAARKEIDAFMNGLIERSPGEEKFRQTVRKVAGPMLACGMV